MDPTTSEVLVPFHEGTVATARELEELLNGAGIDVQLGASPHTCGKPGGGCGCGAKVQVLVREGDLPKATEVWQSKWRDALRAEGTLPATMELVKASEDGELPCPACGTAAPLKAGACSDCGLQLE